MELKLIKMIDVVQILKQAYECCLLTGCFKTRFNFNVFERVVTFKCFYHTITKLYKKSPKFINGAIIQKICKIALPTAFYCKCKS